MLKVNEVSFVGKEVSFSKEGKKTYEGDVRAYMREVYPQHIDPKCNVLNTTGLAEDAANNFDLFTPDYQTPEDLFEWANDLDQELFEKGLLNV